MKKKKQVFFQPAQTEEEKKKRIRNIIITAVVLVIAAVACYFAMPKNKDISQSSIFDQAEVEALAEQVVEYINEENGRGKSPCIRGLGRISVYHQYLHHRGNAARGYGSPCICNGGL